jgi:hypothetical protein
VPDPKQRHGCLTAYLVAMLVLNSLAALLYIVGVGFIKQSLPNAPAWTFPVLAAAATLNVVFAVALLRWKKWGFFGFVATSTLALCVNLTIGVNIAQVILGLAGIAILYGVLHIGNEKKGWTQLE